jgi:hypothetical protein
MINARMWHDTHTNHVCTLAGSCWTLKGQTRDPRAGHACRVRGTHMIHAQMRHDSHRGHGDSLPGSFWIRRGKKRDGKRDHARPKKRSHIMPARLGHVAPSRPLARQGGPARYQMPSLHECCVRRRQRRREHVTAVIPPLSPAMWDRRRCRILTGRQRTVARE